MSGPEDVLFSEAVKAEQERLGSRTKFVDREWAFMFGARLAEDGDAHPSVLIADRSFADRANEQPRLTRLAQSSDVFVFLEDATASRR